MSSGSAASVADTIGKFRSVSGDPKHVPPDLKVVAFSDSIIRARPQSTSSGLFRELQELLHAQCELIGSGILVRGGMALGDVAYSSDTIFGPGFIEAYELESQFARYPRIAISPSLLQSFSNGRVTVASHHSLADEAQYIRKLLVQGDDGIWFIDYLRAYEAELDDHRLNLLFLRAHCDIIINLGRKLKLAASQLSSLALKANWLANYHNSVLDGLDPNQLGEDFLILNDLRIPQDLLPSLFTFDNVLISPSRR